MATNQIEKRDWVDLEDEDEEKLVPHRKTEIITRTKANGATTIQEVVSQTKWCLPVRKQVKDRKNWAKFGEVASIPKGEHRPGDFAVDNPIEIQTSGDQGEMRIVSQLSRMTADTFKISRDAKKLEDFEKGFSKDNKPEGEKKVDKWDKMFTAASRIGNEFAIKVSNIVSYEKEFRDTEDELNEFFEDLFERLNVDCRKKKYLSSKETKRFLGKAFFTFTKEEDAKKALEELSNTTYNSSVLEAEPAEPAGSSLTQKPPVRRY